ncbi:MAG: zf-HC2 domain-containing protein [Deltaproteobacteria bacterium]|nr:zf-HC2 domain-containing protein [Deltaproteobacteria bacterium]MCF8118816.1 zf-HC2 domain-containing protein [Deltaproteobacteria bacterium]
MTDDYQENFERISDYLDGELSPEECRKIEDHLKECPQCRACFHSLKQMRQFCEQASQEKLPSETHRRILETLRKCLEHEHQ